MLLGVFAILVIGAAFLDLEPFSSNEMTQGSRPALTSTRPPQPSPTTHSTALLCSGGSNPISETNTRDEPFDTLDHTLQWLHHTIEVETASDTSICQQSTETHQQALEAVLQDDGNHLVDDDTTRKSVGIHVTILPKDSSFDFDTVHHLPLPKIVERKSLVLEAVYLEGDQSKYFVRIKVDLNGYDGVTALHAGLNLIECLEHGNATQLSSYPFSTSNPPLPDPEQQLANFQAQQQRIQKSLGEDEATQNVPSAGTEWSRTARVAEEFESIYKGNRPAMRISDVKLKFPEILSRIDKAKKQLELPFYAATVNFAPNVAVALCPTLNSFLDKEEKIHHITFPPEGTGPPPPMNEQHAQDLFNTVFLNSYGKHQAPRTTHSKVVGYTWDWSGLLATFPPFFVVCQIQETRFLYWSASQPEFEQLMHSKILEDLGEGSTVHPFQGRSIYQSSEVSHIK